MNKTAIDRLIESIEEDITRMSNESFEQFLGLPEYQRKMENYRRELSRAQFFKRLAASA